MFEYKNESTLFFHEIHALHFDFCAEEYGVEDDGHTYHGLQGEFFYCGLLVDGYLLLRETELEQLMPALQPSIHLVRGTTAYVHSAMESGSMSLFARHISTMGLRGEDEEVADDEEDEDEEMLFLWIDEPGA